MLSKRSVDDSMAVALNVWMNMRLKVSGQFEVPVRSCVREKWKGWSFPR